MKTKYNYYNKLGGIKFENNKDQINNEINTITKKLQKLEREYNIDITVMTTWKYHEPNYLCDIDTEVLIDNFIKKDVILKVMDFYVDYRNDPWYFDSGKKLFYTVVDDLKKECNNIIELENKVIETCNNTVKNINEFYIIPKVHEDEKSVMLI